MSEQASEPGQRSHLPKCKVGIYSRRMQFYNGIKYEAVKRYFRFISSLVDHLFFFFLLFCDSFFERQLLMSCSRNRLLKLKCIAAFCCCCCCDYFMIYFCCIANRTILNAQTNCVHPTFIYLYNRFVFNLKQ